MEQEDRIKRVLQSLKGINRAKAPKDGFSSIQQKIAREHYSDQGFGNNFSAYFLKLAAMITLILSFNIWALSYYFNSEETSTETSIYSQVTTDLYLYEDE